MPRKPRFYLPDVTAHVIQRGNNRQAVFVGDEDYHAYLRWLGEGALQHGCSIHAYVLMTNHVHLLLTPTERDSISRMIQYVGRRYVTYFNHQYSRTGTLWEGRHKGCLVANEHYLLTCSRYIELNPVRAGMVSLPVDYRWSSYHANALGKADGLVKPHSAYRALGSNQEDQLHAYRELFRTVLESDQVHQIRTTAQTGTPLGNDRFRSEIEQLLQCKLGYAERGRPRKVDGKILDNK